MSKPKPSLATKSEEVTSKLTSSPSTTQRELLSLTNLLHLINHHNKNQHRLSKWYKSLCTFRRQVAKLLVEVRELDTALAFSVVNKTQDGKKLGAERKGKEGKYVRLAREKVEERVRFWGQFCEERWFVAFSNLTADGQYASVGLTLLACLAKAKSVVRPFSNVQEGEQKDVVAEVRVEAVPSGGEDDLGEIIKRETLVEAAEVKKPKKPIMIENEIDIDEEDITSRSQQDRKNKKRKNPVEESTHSISTPDSTAIKKAKKKKRKQGDAFDDLFSSLL